MTLGKVSKKTPTEEGGGVEGEKIKSPTNKLGGKGDLPFLNFSFKSRDQTVTLGKGMGGEGESFMGVSAGAEGWTAEIFFKGVLGSVRTFCNDT